MFEFFKSSKGNESGKSGMKMAFENADQWPQILEMSKEGPVFIFKHSSRCGISSVVLNRFEKQIAQIDGRYYQVHIQAHRELSNWLADHLEIRHESPQLIVIKHEKVVAHDSHYGLLDILPKLG
ncbi:bacillithiol system redox-active protein YtxJ [Lutimonas sp.]|uniref:bacillithiol system redox-active protein YtxJ n=1 Tax=Lutimonas sp. TaxID=1872403 RepID=UPI003D9AF584